MLIKRAPDTFEKLHALSGMASDDILSRPRPGERQRAPYAVRERSPAPGVYKAQMPNGKTISLMRVMYTDFCKYDCHYCPNSTWVPRKRFAFKPDELAGAFDEMRRRHIVQKCRRSHVLHRQVVHAMAHDVAAGKLGTIPGQREQQLRA